jgi:hypothetical protein
MAHYSHRAPTPLFELLDEVVPDFRTVFLGKAGLLQFDLDAGDEGVVE